MKTKKVILIILSCFAASLVSVNSIKAETSEIQHNKTIKIKLRSMQCEICKNTIREAIEKVNGVAKVIINLEKKTAIVTFNSDVTNKEEIEKAITSAGYDANDNKANQEAYNNLMECCKVK